MKEERLKLIDLGSLIDKLNESRFVSEEKPSESEDEIERVPFVDTTPKTTPLWHRIVGRKILTRGIYHVKGIERFPNIGYIFIEAGKTDASSEYSAVYESMELRLTGKFRLKDGRTIPKCSVYFEIEDEEWGGPNKRREDHIFKFGLIPFNADLSRLILTEWFYKGPKLLAEHK